jgi:repressor LexA
MVDLGILDGDYVNAVQQNTASSGDIIVAGIPGDEATVKTYRPDGAEIVLVPANSTMEPMRFGADEVTIFGRVVTVMRRL